MRSQLTIYFAAIKAGTYQVNRRLDAEGVAQTVTILVEYGTKKSSRMTRSYRTKLTFTSYYSVREVDGLPDTNESPIPGLKVAGPNDLKELLSMQAAMGFDWLAYFNQRLLDEVRKGVGLKRRLTHLKFVPDVENGLLYIVPAAASEYGAIKLDYTAPETGAQVSLYVPLLRFELEREQGRQRIFEAEPHKQGDGKVYLALNVRDSKSVPVKRRAARAGSEERPASQAAASGQPEAGGGTGAGGGTDA